MMHLMTKINSIMVLILLFCNGVLAQKTDSTETLQLNFQQTVVTQHHQKFSAKYTGVNSLHPNEETQTSLTTTFYSGIKLAKNSNLYFNPEIAGGAGLSRATGIAGFANGETFRVGNPKPQVYVARLYIEQFFALSKTKKWQSKGINQLAGYIPQNYIKVVVGRFAISDFFDNNSYSHDPRTQFLNWSLMGNGAYDYAANTRGYTWGTMFEFRKKTFAIRAAGALVPKEANASNMNTSIKEALAKQMEIEQGWGNDKKGILRLLIFHNKANMGNYDLAVSNAANLVVTPNIISSRQVGRIKFGFGINLEQKVTKNTGLFARTSWNDGKNETWMFTEIDNSISVGVLGNGSNWKRPNDTWGIAAVSNGISTQHQKYLAAGGSGFMVGDGALNYGREFIFEAFYNALLHEDHFFITPDYQLVFNPAYNKDRGPVSIYAIRVQTKF